MLFRSLGRALTSDAGVQAHGPSGRQKVFLLVLLFVPKEKDASSVLEPVFTGVERRLGGSFAAQTR